jgi:murein DD-endopeptidase MepM/ murein hydrolase activator NlpD
MTRTAVAAGSVVVAVALGVGTLGVTGASRTATSLGAPLAAEVAGSAPVGTPTRAPADAGDGTAAASVRTFVVPLDPPVVVARPFDAPPQPWAAGHRGVDLSARPGQVVRAPQAGVVSFAGTVVDRGVVTVAHPDGLRSSLEPVDPSVRAGQRVLRGQAVGTVAAVAGHCAPATCLHWGLRRGDAYLDPMRWVLDRGPVVLLPTG